MASYLVIACKVLQKLCTRVFDYFNFVSDFLIFLIVFVIILSDFSCDFLIFFSN